MKLLTLDSTFTLLQYNYDILEYISVYKDVMIGLSMDKEYSGEDIKRVNQAISRGIVNKNAAVVYYLGSSYRTFFGGKMDESLEVLNLIDPPLAVVKYCSQGKLRKIHLIGREEDIGTLEREIEK